LIQYPSKLIEEAVGEIAKLPGIGKKTALRLALHLLKSEESNSVDLAKAIINLRTLTKYCSNCHNISDDDICGICSSHRRDKSILCIVEDTRDVLAIENTSQFFGVYHVLGGVISPIEGIGPADLNIDTLVKRIQSGEIKEVIMALSPTMEGDTTSFYLTKKIKELSTVRITSIARGIPIGGELEYADEVTLGRSIVSRTLYDQN
jgi:recombination protein RecR